MQAEVLFDPHKFLRELNKASIRYVLIGRQALILYGAPFNTHDYDFFISAQKDNLERFLKVCARLDYEVVPFGEKDPVKSYKLSVHAGGSKIDVFRAKSYGYKGEPDGVIDFDSIWKRHKIVTLSDGTPVYVPSLEDLEKTKRIRLSPKDIEDIKYIRRLMERETGEE